MKEIILKIKTTFILFSFLGIQLISIGCSFIDFVLTFSDKNHSTEKHNHHGHDHEHEHSENTDDHSNNTDEEECCAENSIVFLSGIEMTQSAIDLTIRLSCTDLGDFYNEFKLASIIKEHTLNQIRPPPLIYFSRNYYRLIIQSLQI